MKEYTIPKIKKINLNNEMLEKISLALVFLSMVLIGSDRISFDIGGFTIRFVQILLILESFVLYLQGKYKMLITIPMIAVIASHILSTIFTYDIKASFAYDFWVIYNFLFVLYVFYSYAKSTEKEKVIDLILLSFIIQSIYIYIQFIFGSLGYNDPFFSMQHHMDVYRPAIWFYEPSYVATYFSIYFALSLYLLINIRSKKYIINSLNSLLSLILITSTTGYLAIGFTMFLMLIMNIKAILNINKKKLIGILIVIAISIIIVLNLNITFIDVFLGRIFKDGLINASGGRVYNWIYTFNIFIENPIIGIGPNAYMKYTGLATPPTNVSLELLVNLGILGFGAFYYFLISVLREGYKKVSKTSIYNKAIVFSIIVFMVTLQANQNYMRLYLWMFLGICIGFARKED